MAPEITVTRAQRAAARGIIARSVKSGRPVPPEITKIAEAPLKRPSSEKRPEKP